MMILALVEAMMMVMLMVMLMITLMNCICQHRQMTLFSRILSFQRSFIPRNLFHFGDVSFWRYAIDMH